MERRFQDTTLADLVDRSPISTIYRALGGDEPRKGRARAFWRDGKSSRSVALDDGKGAFYDHGSQAGGGVLKLIETVTGYSKADALRWLASHHGIALESRQSPAELATWQRRRAEAVRQAAGLASWRQAERRRLIQDRNLLWDSAAAIDSAARTLLRNPGDDDEAAWAIIWQHALDLQQGDHLQRHLEHLESLSVAELAALRGRAAVVAA